MSNILFKTANKGNKSNYKKSYKNEGEILKSSMTPMFKNILFLR